MPNFQLPIFNTDNPRLALPAGNREFSIEHLLLVIDCFGYGSKTPLHRGESFCKWRPHFRGNAWLALTIPDENGGKIMTGKSPLRNAGRLLTCA
jgi:hypothetical protein